MIMGTAAYMPPEQAKGKTVDQRADTWAFGVVFYEMLTGKTLFSGETVAETLAFVMTKEPEWDSLPAQTPLRIRELLKRCLTKDPRRRIQAIGEARISIEDTIARPETEIATASTVARTGHRSPRFSGVLPWAVAIVLGTALALALAALWQPSGALPTVRVNADLGADVFLNQNNGAAAFLSPDSSIFAFIGRGINGKELLYIRKLDNLRADPLTGTEGAHSAFFSPDGKWIGFFADGKLKKISVTGGAAITLCDAPNDRGGAWGDDGNIVFTPDPTSPLFRVGSAGGTPQQLTKFEMLEKDALEVTHRWPQVLPGSKVLLFTSNIVTGSYANAFLIAQSLVTGERKVLQRGGFYARFLVGGYITYVHENTLFVAPFDSRKLQLTAPPVPAIDGVSTYSNNGVSQMAFSDTGTAVYLPGTDFGGGFQLDWLDRQGKTPPLRSSLANIWSPRFSPDGHKIALESSDRQRNIWIYEWSRDTLSRLTDGIEDRVPVWSPGGERIIFRSSRAGAANIFSQRSDGTGDVQRLTESKNMQTPNSFHPSGKFLAYEELNGPNGMDIMILPLEGSESTGWKPGKPSVFLGTQWMEQSAMFSPDGRWIAYQSNETGKTEVYVRPFPGPGGKWQISSDGGSFPVWSRTTKELFYRSNDMRIMVAPYTVIGDSFKADKPKLWSDGQFSERVGNPTYDVHPDGQRFAVIKQQNPTATANRVVFIFNFFDELRRIAPVSKK
jgi:serine/threonine-protein kinase